jgi:hypothetical protein
MQVGLLPMGLEGSLRANVLRHTAHKGWGSRFRTLRLTLDA